MSAEPHPAARVGIIWTHNLRQPPAKISLLQQITFRCTGLDSSALLEERLGAPAETGFNQRLESGRRCYTAWVGEDLAGYGWVTFTEEGIGEHGLRVRLQPCEAYLWDFYTLPAFRGQHIYAAMLAWVLQALGDEGFCRAWIGADYDNAPSQRGIDRAGFLRVADLLVLMEERQRVMWIEGYPGVADALVSEARRVFLGGVEVLRLVET